MKKEDREGNQYKAHKMGADKQKTNHGKRKDPAAVSLGRRGGLVGGKARAQKLTAEQRIEIARRAAEARWKKRRD